MKVHFIIDNNFNTVSDALLIHTLVWVVIIQSRPVGAYLSGKQPYHAISMIIMKINAWNKSQHKKEADMVIVKLSISY